MDIYKCTKHLYCMCIYIWQDIVQFLIDYWIPNWAEEKCCSATGLCINMQRNNFYSYLINIININYIIHILFNYTLRQGYFFLI